MTTPVPLQFLVGLTRLIAVYFGLRGLESSAGTVMSYQIQSVMMPDHSSKIMSVWAIYLPAVVFYLALAVGTWFAAPFIVRVSSRISSTLESETPPKVCWNEVMIFLTGVLLMGWGLARFGDTLATYFREKNRTIPYQPMSGLEALHLLFSAIFIGFGGLMMARFPSVYRWLRKRSGEQAAADAPVTSGK